MTVLVSVIVPVFNAQTHLRHCLDSLLGQSHSELEVIAVDDGSTDGSANILQEFARKDARVRVLTQPNRGVSAARNVGLDEANGDYVSFVDADDWLEPNTYEYLLKELLKVGAEVLAFDYFVDSGEESQARRDLSGFEGALDRRSSVEAVLSGPNRFLWTRIFKRSVLDSLRLREDLHWGEDTVFVVEALMCADVCGMVSTPLYHYVQSPESATRSRFNTKRLTGVAMTAVLEDLVADAYPELVDYVLQTRVNIIGVLVHDMYAAESTDPSGYLRELRGRVRRDLRQVLRSRRLSWKTKVKSLTLALSPRIFEWLHRLGLRARRLS